MLIELPILGLLREKPMHGYELRQRLETLLGFAWRPSFGALYPMLGRLEVGGFITKFSVQQGPGPQRQVYAITNKGLARLRYMLTAKPAPIGLPLQILFLDQLSEQERKGFLRQARKQKAEALKRMESEFATSEAQTLSKYQRLLMEYGLKTIQREITLLEQLAQE